MKTYKYFIAFIMAFISFLPLQAQTIDREAIYVYQYDGNANIFFRNEVTSILTEMRDGEMYMVIQTGEKQHAFPISNIQSVSFVNPEDDAYRPSILLDENAPTFGKFVDMGLPSGTMWASFNVGASTPYEFGGYYAWGETEEKEVYNESTFRFYQSTMSNTDICGTELDVAHVKWGGAWRLPTYSELNELLNYSTFKVITYNGVRGLKLTSKVNGNSIFLPYSGYRKDGELISDKGVFYWMVNPTWLGTVSDVDLTRGPIFGFYSLFGNLGEGQSVRPVRNLHVSNDALGLVAGESKTVRVTAGSGSYTIENSDAMVANVTLSGNQISIDAINAGEATVTVLDTQYGLKATISVNVVESEAIDLGLPSGTKWASFNVGATKPEEYGGYYSWGETERKGYYYENTYVHYDDSDDTYIDLGDIGGTEYDVAHVTWGGNWRMPSEEECQELIDNCTSEQTTLNGVEGRRFTSNINGNSIFLPAGGYKYKWSGHIYAGYSYGYYLSSTDCGNHSAYNLFFYSDRVDTRDHSRYCGCSVRPVMRTDNNTNERIFIYDYELNGTKYALYRQPNKDDVCYNADGAPYYRTSLTLDVTENAVVTTYTLDDDLYIDEGDAMIPCMAIDLNTNKMFVFVNSSNGWAYSLDGYCYVSPLDDFNFQKETVFTDANWGWWPYFTYHNGKLRLQHFSFAGYYAMTSTRNNDGTWSTEWGEDIYPDDFKAQSEQMERVLVIQGYTPQHIPAEAIDLGLPSGTKWASYNVGATKPEEYGGYFAWGEIEEKDYYDWSNYTLCDGSGESCYEIGVYISGSEHDVAHMLWGNNWEMPYVDDFIELYDNCTSEWTTLKGVKGLKYTSKINGNSIFLPAAGYCWGGRLDAGRAGYYWSSTHYPEFSADVSIDLCFYAGDNKTHWGNDYRGRGQSVRPVIRQ